MCDYHNFYSSIEDFFSFEKDKYMINERQMIQSV